MRLIIAYFIFIAALLVALPAFGTHMAEADAETQVEEEVTPTPANAGPGALRDDDGAINVDIHAI